MFFMPRADRPFNRLASFISEMKGSRSQLIAGQCQQQRSRELTGHFLIVYTI